MTVPITTQLFPQQQFFDLTAKPLSGGWIHSYTDGTALSLYSDRNRLSKIPNPFQLDSQGKVPQGFRGVGTYEITVKDSTDTTTYYSFNDVLLGYGTTLATALGNLAVSSNTWSTTTGDDIIFLTATTGVFKINGTSLSSGNIKLYEDTDNGTNYINLIAPSAVTTNKTISLPDVDINIMQSQLGQTETGAFTEFTDALFSPDVTDSIYTSSNTYLFLSKNFTPKSASSILKVEIMAVLGSSTYDGGAFIYPLKQGMFLMTETNAIAGAVKGDNNRFITHLAPKPFKITHFMTSGTTSEMTFKVYGIGFTSNSGGVTVNRYDINGMLATRKLGGVMASSITITEYPA